MKFKLPHMLIVTTSLLLPFMMPLQAEQIVTPAPATESASQTLELKVRGMLAAHRDMNFDNLVVKAHNGSILLMGQAHSLSQKKLATHYAESVEGVTTVTNNLTVAPPKVQKAAALVEPLSDADITAKVQQVLQYHRAHYAKIAQVETRNGVVLFSCKSMKPKDRDLVGMLVADTVGVKYMIDADDGVTAYCADPARVQPMANEQLASTLGGNLIAQTGISGSDSGSR
jgi:osmotically-inducible protein OsmY